MTDKRWSRGRRFRIAFLAVTLLIAGGASYLASPSPDGLDSAIRQGCQIVQRDGADELTGRCIAQDSREHPLAGSPLADYSVRGVAASGGLAGVAGVLLTLALAAGVFRLVVRGD